MLHFAIFGIHPRLSLAEFRALKSAIPAPICIGNGALFDDSEWDGAELMNTLGGTVKLGDVIATVSAEELNGRRIAEELGSRIGDKAIDFGLTVIGSKRFMKLPIEFKRALKSRGIASRWVTGKEGSEIAPAAIAKMNLTSKGFDLCVFVDGSDAHIGVTTHVQDADAWSLRDYGRPARSEAKGMLPPKLARMMVNLAMIPTTHVTLLDPFCGSGTILMEAALSRKDVALIGSDNDQTQIADTKKNNSWLMEKNILSENDEKRITVFLSDARHLSQKLEPNSVHRVVSEGYLGPLLHGSESLLALKRNAKEISDLWIETLTELRPLLTKDARLVCVWPAFKTTGGVVRVDLEQDIPAIGYATVDPFAGWNIQPGPLLYHREGQRVMRRIVIIEPK